MKTLNENWREFRDAAYPNGTGAQQNIECHQAFMAGALCMIQSVDEATSLPEEQAMVALSKLKNEVWEINAHRAHTLEARN